MSPLSIIALAVTAYLSSSSSLRSIAVPPIDAALARWDMDKARALAEAMPAGADRCAVEALIASRDNRVDEAKKMLPSCLTTLQQTRSPRAYIAFDTLLDVYLRRGEYTKANDLIMNWLGTHDYASDAKKRADLEGYLATTAVLRGLSMPKATGSRSAMLQSYLNVLGTRTVDLSVGSASVPWLIDTGANSSVVTDSTAKRLKLAVHDTTQHVVGLTGHSISTRIAVVKRLPIGGIILHNVVVIVVPDADLYIRTPEADYQIEAILGLPSLALLGRFQIDDSGTFAINRSAPLLRSGAILYLNQLTPLVEVEIQGRKRVLSVDTGANRTTLHASYAACFVDNKHLWGKRRHTSLGLGGGIEGEDAVEPRLVFRVGVTTVTERNVAVASEGDRNAPVLGNLGQSALGVKSSYTFDFRSMRLLLGEDVTN